MPDIWISQSIQLNPILTKYVLAPRRSVLHLDCLNITVAAWVWLKHWAQKLSLSSSVLALQTLMTQSSSSRNWIALLSHYRLQWPKNTVEASHRCKACKETKWSGWRTAGIHRRVVPRSLCLTLIRSIHCRRHHKSSETRRKAPKLTVGWRRLLNQLVKAERMTLHRHSLEQIIIRIMSGTKTRTETRFRLIYRAVGRPRSFSWWRLDLSKNRMIRLSCTRNKNASRCTWRYTRTSSTVNKRRRRH